MNSSFSHPHESTKSVICQEIIYVIHVGTDIDRTGQKQEVRKYSTHKNDQLYVAGWSYHMHILSQSKL